jgi:hypothetical protein
MRTLKPFPALREVVDVMAGLAVAGFRDTDFTSSHHDGRRRRSFYLEGEAVTSAGGWPRSWWQSFKGMLNQNRSFVSSEISSRLPENVVLDSASSKSVWFDVVEGSKKEVGR